MTHEKPGFQIVYDLVHKYLYSGRTIITDNFYTSSFLGRSLYNDKLFLVGTVRKNRDENPKAFISENINVRLEQIINIICEFQKNESSYVFRGPETFLKYKPKKEKTIYLYSTKHHKQETDLKKAKPQIVTYYNNFKSGVDILDEICSHTAYLPLTKRWNLRLFNLMITMAANNAHVLSKSQASHRSSNIKIAKALIAPLKKRRADSNHYIHKALSEIDILYESIRQRHSGALKIHSKVERCYKCRKTSRSLNCCGSCGNKGCEKHSYEFHYLCEECRRILYVVEQEREHRGKIQGAIHWRKV